MKINAEKIDRNLINQINCQTFELEQNEKNFSILNQNFRKLNLEYSQLFDEKLRLEAELKHANEMYTKQINEIGSDMISLQDIINEK